MSGAMLAIQSTVNTAVPPPSGTVLLLSSMAGPWAWTSALVGDVNVEGWGAGGPGSYGTSGKSFVSGPGGGGGGYFKKKYTVAVGDTMTGAVGKGGNFAGPSKGGDTTYPTGSLVAHGGTAGVFGVAEGVGGTATGGTTNTTGHNGGLTNTWDGGGAGNGGGDQKLPAKPATTPGGGGPGDLVVIPGKGGGLTAQSGANGQIKITVA